MITQRIYFQFKFFHGFMEALAGQKTRKSHYSTGDLRGVHLDTTEGLLRLLGKVKKHVHSHRLTCQAGRVLRGISSYINPINASGSDTPTKDKPQTTGASQKTMLDYFIKKEGEHELKP